MPTLEEALARRGRPVGEGAENALGWQGILGGPSQQGQINPQALMGGGGLMGGGVSNPSAIMGGNLPPPPQNPTLTPGQSAILNHIFSGAPCPLCGK